MSPVKKNDAEEERLAALEEIGIEEKALVYDEAGDKLLVSDDTAAIKDFYARLLAEVSRLGWKSGAARQDQEAHRRDASWDRLAGQGRAEQLE